MRLGPCLKCPGHRKICLAVLTVFLTLILISGFSYPFHYPWSVWPFQRGWFMFYYGNPVYSKLIVTGILENSESVTIDMSRWFTYPVGFETARYSEVIRTLPNLIKLADYVCIQYNQDALPGETMTLISLTDVTWRHAPRQHKPVQEISISDLTFWSYLDKRPCHL